MIRAIIIDDERRSRVNLASSIGTHCPDVSIIGEAESVISGLKLLLQMKPDLVFLDIMLSDGSAFNLLQQLDKIDFKIIFTTAYSEYAIKAFKFSAIDYLLKPIDMDELVAAVGKIKNENKVEQTTSRMEILKENLSAQNQIHKIVLSTQENMHVVNVDDIIRCEAQNNCTLFHLTNNRKILITRTLKEFDELLQKHPFMRVHKSHLINFNAIVRFMKLDTGYVVMSDESVIPVSQRKKEEVLKLFEGFNLK